MSTDYYLACMKCKVCIDVASDGFSGFQFYRAEPDCLLKVHDFLAEHVLCGGPLDIRLLSEHTIHDDESMKHIEWTPDPLYFSPPYTAEGKP